MGNFFNWVENTIDDNPGHYHYIKFDDYLAGEEREQEEWINETKESIQKLLKELFSIQVGLNEFTHYANETKLKDIINQDLSYREAGNIISYVDNIIDQLENIANLLSMGKNNFSFARLEANKLRTFKENTKIYNLVRERFKEPNFKTIQKSVDFIKQMNEILQKNKSLKNAFYATQLNAHHSDNIVHYAQSFLEKMQEFLKKYPNALDSMHSVYHKGTFNLVMQKINNIANGQDVKSNYKPDDFNELYNVFYVLFDPVDLNVVHDTYGLQAFHDSIANKLHDLQKSIERTHGRLKFEQFLMEARELFGMPVNKDPAFTHAIMFDKAFADSDDPADKDKWIQSVRDTASEFHTKLYAIVNQIYREGETANCFKNDNISQNEIEHCLNYIRDICNMLSRIENYHTNIENAHISDLTSYTKDTGFGVPAKWVEAEIQAIPAIELLFKSSVMNIIKKALNWMLTIAIKGYQGKSDIHRHIYKDYINKEVELAQDFMDVLNGKLLPIVSEKSRNFAYSNNINWRIIIQSVSSLWTNKGVSFIDSIAKNEEVKFFDKDNHFNETLLKDLQYSINKILYSYEYELKFKSIIDLVKKLSEKLRKLMIALHVNHGELKG